MKWFRNMKIGKKLSAIIILMVALIVVIIVGFSFLEFTKMNQEAASEEAEKAVAGLQHQLEFEKSGALITSSLLASDPRITKGVEENDRALLQNVLSQISNNSKIDFITITDRTGTVIFRAHEPDNYGDSVAGQENIKKALQGEAAAMVEKGTAIPLSARAGCPIYNENGVLIGAVSTGTRLDSSELLDALKDIYHTELTIFLNDVRIATTIISEGERVIGTQLDPAVADIVLAQKTEYSGNADILGTKYITHYTPLLGADGGAIGVLFAGRSIEDFNQDLRSLVSVIAFISVVSFAVVITILLLLIRASVTKPIKEVAALASAMASGDLSRKTTLQSKDEIGQLAAIFDNDVRRAFMNIEQARTDLTNAAEQISCGSAQVSAGNQAITAGATEQSGALEEITASLTKMAEQTKQNAENANSASELSVTVKKAADQGSTQMGNMQKAMEDINNSSSMIFSIIKVIDDIAFQTNILALNAAVEAARAGAHGKGFAVVAEEVRTLAGRSAQAASETTELINNSVKSVAVGTKIANETAVSLKSITQSVGESADLIEVIAQASNEQANAISQINEAINKLSDVVQSNTATAEETSATSEELSGMSNMLKGMVEKLKLSADIADS